MNKYIIFWDAGYGKSHDVIEAEDREEAETIAYDEWKQEAESSADYGVMEWSEEAEEELL